MTPERIAILREYAAEFRKVDSHQLEDALDALEAAQKRNAELTEALKKADHVVHETWFVLSGGDNPHERCTDCGCAPYGELRGVLKAYEAARAALGKGGVW
jgi:hypothetical protein